MVVETRHAATETSGGEKGRKREKGGKEPDDGGGSSTKKGRRVRKNAAIALVFSPHEMLFFSLMCDEVIRFDRRPRRPRERGKGEKRGERERGGREGASFFFLCERRDEERGERSLFLSLFLSLSLSLLDSLFPPSSFIGAQGNQKGRAVDEEQEKCDEVFRGRGEREGGGVGQPPRAAAALFSIQFKFFFQFSPLSLTLE